jgi:hypothetical protein
MSRSTRSKNKPRATPFKPGDSGLQKLHGQSQMDDILPWLQYGEKLRQQSPYGKDITWFHQGVVAWKDGKEKRFNRLDGKKKEEQGLDPTWFPDINDRHLLKTFYQHPLRRLEGQEVIEGKHKMGLFICYPASPVGMDNETFDDLWMHAWLCIIKAPDADALQGKTVAFWDGNALQRFKKVEKRKKNAYEEAKKEMAKSSTTSEVLPSRTLRSREVSPHTLVKNRPTPIQESAKRMHDVLQGRQLNVVEMYPNFEAVMLGGRGNEQQTNSLPHALEEALKWLSGERGDLTTENLVKAGFELLDR